MADLPSAPRSPLAQLPSAFVGHTGVARAYGNTFPEQRRLSSGQTFVDLSDRGVIQLSGPDRLSWLDSLLSQKLDSLAPGESAEALLLDPHGHIQHVLRLIEDGDNTWILVDAGQAEALTAWLTKMRFMKQVEIADRSADLATVGWCGSVVPTPLAGQLLQLTELPVLWQDPWSEVTAGGWQYSTAEHPGVHWNYTEAVLERAQLDGLAQTASDALAGTDALEALRIAAWRPRVTELDENALPHEFDWLRTAVHLNKGCYRGQETVAKVHNLGHPPRRLTFLCLDGVADVLPEHGAPVFAGEVQVGHVTSSARHYEEGPIALAVLKRNTDPSATLEVESEGHRIPATQVVIVPPEAGRTADVPRLPRLGAVRREN